jgi:hypothetical protein
VFVFCVRDRSDPVLERRLLREVSPGCTTEFLLKPCRSAHGRKSSLSPPAASQLIESLNARTIRPAPTKSAAALCFSSSKLRFDPFFHRFRNDGLAHAQFRLVSNFVF